MSIAARTIPALCLALMAAACATGIDSTPRITAADVERQGTAPGPDELLLASVVPEPLASWTPGKRLRVTDDRLKLMLGNTAPERPLAGLDITYSGASERPSPLGGTVAVLHFLGPSGETLEYAAAQPLAALLERQGRVDVPFTIEMSMVESARSLLQGRRLWVLTAEQYDPGTLEPRRGRKYVEVEVTDVVAATPYNPLGIVFREAAAEVSAPAEALLMVDPQQSQGGRSFAGQFSLSDPRQRYPAVNREVWPAIQSGRVARGMTQLECRLALGAPAGVDRKSSGGYIIETWTYDGGRWLRFEDGTLTSGNF